MYTAKVYRLMIGCLSGTMEEVYTATEVVRKWNQQKAEATGKLYLPVVWSSKAEELEEVDVIIGLVGNWISNPAFIQKCVDLGKKVVLLFNDFQDPRNTIQGEYDAVVSFKHSIHGQCAIADYHDKDSLSALLNDTLDTL